jgi:hypothetical protein
MVKPSTLDGYSDQYTLDCERVLLTLLRGLGPWKESVYLVGGLTPRYLVRQRPPLVPPHAGTQDVDLVIDLQILADTEAYSTLEINFKRMGFLRAENEHGQKLSWRWQTRTEHGAVMILELLADAPEVCSHVWQSNAPSATEAWGTANPQMKPLRPRRPSEVSIYTAQEKKWTANLTGVTGTRGIESAQNI